jgi:sulfite exporter TauE/SafE
MTLGAILGATGHLFATVIRDGQISLSIIVGPLMALLGLGLLGLLPLQRWLASIKLGRIVASWLRPLLTSDHPAAPFGLGLANGLLPCGPVYTMGLLAATSGDALKGLSVMLLFGLGTLPAMLGFAFTASLLSLRLRSGLYRLAAILVVTIGLQLTLRGLASAGQISHIMVGSMMLW